MTVEAEKPVSDAPKVPERGAWASKTEFILSCAGYAIGIGNVWRFPYLCYRNGGGAFLVPYLLMLFLCGIPLFFMESCMGQFGGTGCITMFRMSPLFKGAGFAIVIVNVICTMYYNVIISYPLMFLSMSMRSKLPWEDCENPWNSERCIKINDPEFRNASDIAALFQRVRTPAEEFFSNHVLQISEGVHEIGGIVWPLFACNLISWIVVFLCICNGVKSVGKVVYFTATFPFIILFVLFIRGVTLPGAMDGILFYINPQWSQLSNLKVWADAAIQIFFSLGPGWGGIVNMASYNRFRNDNTVDSIFIPILNCGTSIFAGFVVFSVLGFMAHRTGLPVSLVATGGPSLAFETYPEAITMLPWPQLWSVLFFAMLYFLGMDSCFVQIEAIISSVTDAYPNLRKHKKLVAFISMTILFLGSLIFVTNGGMYILQMFDWYAASVSVISICLVEAIVVGWTYGCDNFVRDVEFMIGKKIHPWWPFSWKYVTPIILSFIFFTTIVFNTRLTYNGVEFPEWAVILGWCSCLVSMVCIPSYAVYHFCSTKGTFRERLDLGINPTDEWGPQKPEDREAWKKFIERRNPAANNALNSVKSEESEKTVAIDSESKMEKRKSKRTKKSRRMKNKVVFTSSVDPFDGPLQWWESQPIKYAFSNPPVRSRLEMLMGSNIVRLTDRRYMLRLMARIRQDYEKRQQIRIEERKKNELMRTKMMILNRFIPVQDAPVEIRKYPLFQLYLYCDSIIEARQQRRSARHVKMTESLYRMLYPDVKDKKEDLDSEDEEIYMRRIVVNGVEQLIPLTHEEAAAAKRDHESKKDIENGYILSQEEYDRLHYETEAVKELREAQTVEDMYTKAHEILGILYSYADEGRYKKIEKPEEHVDNEEKSKEDEETKTETELPKE